MTLDLETRRARDHARKLVRQINQAERAARPKPPKVKREARIAHVNAKPHHGQAKDKPYLGWIRQLPCVAGAVEGGCSGGIQACHVRMSVPGRPNPGLGRKADDRLTWPGCAHHHLHDQHTGSERAFWARLGIDPFAFMAALSAAHDADQPGAPVVHLFANRGAKTVLGPSVANRARTGPYPS